jgi:2'-5' RNA ligase
MRLFAAVFLPESTVAALAKAQAALAARLDGVKWTPPASLHLTLKFLGDVPEDRLSPAEDALARAAAAPGFSLELAGVGAFPSLRFPRIVWAGARRGTEEFGRLAARADEEFAAAGFPREERPFHAHVTLGRRKSPGPAREASWASIDLPVFGGVPVDEICLVRSRLDPGPARYDVLKRYPLQAL